MEKIDINEPIVEGTKLNILHKAIILNKKEIFNLALIFKGKKDKNTLANINYPDEN